MDTDEQWREKGATLSDKTACKEYGLTHAEIYEAIDAGELHYRSASMHGNPWLRLLRSEVEDLAASRHGKRHLKEAKAKAELARVNRELKLRTRLSQLEKQRVEIMSQLKS